MMRAAVDSSPSLPPSLPPCLGATAVIRGVVSLWVVWLTLSMSTVIFSLLGVCVCVLLANSQYALALCKSNDDNDGYDL